MGSFLFVIRMGFWTLRTSMMILCSRKGIFSRLFSTVPVFSHNTFLHFLNCEMFYILEISPTIDYLFCFCDVCQLNKHIRSFFRLLYVSVNSVYRVLWHCASSHPVPGTRRGRSSRIHVSQECFDLYRFQSYALNPFFITSTTFDISSSKSKLADRPVRVHDSVRKDKIGFLLIRRLEGPVQQPPTSSLEKTR